MLLSLDRIPIAKTIGALAIAGAATRTAVSALAADGLGSVVVPGIFSITTLVLGWFGNAWLAARSRRADGAETRRLERRDDRQRAEKQRDDALEKYWTEREKVIRLEEQLAVCRAERDVARRELVTARRAYTALEQRHRDALAVLERRSSPEGPPPAEGERRHPS